MMLMQAGCLKLLKEAGRRVEMSESAILSRTFSVQAGDGQGGQGYNLDKRRVLASIVLCSNAEFEVGPREIS